MAGSRKSFCGLIVLILLGLLYLKVQFGGQDEDLKASLERIISEDQTLWPDIAALQGLRLPSESIHVKVNQRESLIRSLKRWQDDLKECQDITSCLLQQEKEFENFLKDIEDQKMQLQLLRASEVSDSYSQKLLVMTDKDKSTEEQVKGEYGLDPHRSEIVSVECLQDPACMPEADSNTVVQIFGRLSEDGQTVSGLSGSSLAEKMLNLSRTAVPLFSLDNKTTTEFQHSFLQTLVLNGIRAVIDVNQWKRQIYKVITQPDSVSKYEIPQENVEPTTQYDHQHILVMEDDKVVTRATQYLYEKYSATSSVYALDEKKRPTLIHGDSAPLTEESRLVLVGHGFREKSGEMTLSGYKAEDVANIIIRANRVGNKIKAISFVACELGSAREFAKAVLEALRAANIEAELHFHRGKVQVMRDGEIITQATDGAEWRRNDDTQILVLVLDENGKIVQKKRSNSKGEAVSNSGSDELIHKKIHPRFTAFRKTRPKQPENFLDQNVMEKFGPTACRELMALTWALFPKDRPRPRKLNINNVKDIKMKYRIRKMTEDDKKVVWIESEQEIKDVLYNCYEIKSAEDVRNIIYYLANEGQNKIIYIKVNGWIFAVDPQNLYVYPVGKELDNNQIENPEKIKAIENCIVEQIGKEKYPDMRKHIYEANIEKSKEKYVQYIKAILRGEPKTSLPLSTEAWCTSYFTASTIAESARNFRTFPLTLAALEMTDSSDNNIREKAMEHLFEEHSMAKGNSWVDPSSRGHRGAARAEGSSKLNNRSPRSMGDLTKDLEMVVGKEVELYQLWNPDPEKVLQEMLRILEKNKVIKPSDRESIEKDYIDFKDKTKDDQASGPLGRYNDDHTTTQDLMSASKVENSFRLEFFFSRLKASVVDQVHTQLKSQHKENLAGMHVQEGSVRIKDGEFIGHLMSAGDEPVEFRVKLSPVSKFYNEQVSKDLDSAAEGLEKHSYVGDIVWSVAKSSTFVLLVILIIRRTERDSKVRDAAQRTEDATNRTKRQAKEQKMTGLITVLVEQEGSVVRVQIELVTPLSHLMITYCEQQGLTTDSVRFYYRDCSVSARATPGELGMKDEDTIEVYTWAIPG